MEKILEQFSRDVTSAASGFYTWKYLLENTSQKPWKEAALIEDAPFWNTVIHSLQVTHVISIGRLFDTDGDALSVHRLIRESIKNIHLFEKPSLRKRRIGTNQTEEPEWLGEFVESAYQATEQDFQKLKFEIKKRQRIYDQKIKPIRHKVFAHTDFDTFKDSKELYSKADINNIEELIVFSEQLYKVIYELFHNGRLTNLDEHKCMSEFYYEDHVSLFLEKLWPRNRPNKAVDTTRA